MKDSQLFIWQKNFFQQLHQQGQSIADMCENGEARRINAYLNNYQGGLTSWLVQIYPQLMLMLGKDCFTTFAKLYLSKYPLQSADFNIFGRYFPYFLSKQKSLSEYPYLQDVGQVDWLCYQSYYAEDSPVFSFDLFAGLSPLAQEQAQFDLAPSLFYIASSWPLEAIWKFHFNDQEIFEIQQQDFDSSYLIFRSGNRPKLQKLTHLEASLIQLLRNNAMLGDLSESLAPMLPEFIQRGWIVSFRSEE